MNGRAYIETGCTTVHNIILLSTTFTWCHEYLIIGSICRCCLRSCCSIRNHLLVIDTWLAQKFAFFSFSVWILFVTACLPTLLFFFSTLVLAWIINYSNEYIVTTEKFVVEVFLNVLPTFAYQFQTCRCNSFRDKYDEYTAVCFNFICSFPYHTHFVSHLLLM